MTRAKFVLAERKSSGRLFYVIQDASQKELEDFIHWVEKQYPEFSPVEVSFTESLYGEGIRIVLYITARTVVEPAFTSRIPIVLRDFPVFIKLEGEITVLGKTEFEAQYNYEPWGCM